MVDIMPNKSIEERKDSNLKDEEKVRTIFSLENEIFKVNISLPFSELIKNTEYRNQILKMFKSEQICVD